MKLTDIPRHPAKAQQTILASLGLTTKPLNVPKQGAVFFDSDASIILACSTGFVLFALGVMLFHAL